MTTSTTKEIIDRIFKEPGIKYELTEFESLGKPIHEILSISPKTVETGRDTGKTKYYLKSIVPFSSGKDEVYVYMEGGKSSPEEIIRQLWVYKLIHQYGYQSDEIDLEKSVQFGTEVGTKAADIIVYTNDTKETPKIIVECKKPKRKDGIEQLKSYMNAKGAPVAVWSNGSDSIILYRPYPKEFDDTLFDIPRRGQEPRDVLEAKKTLLQLRTEFNFKKIVQDLEELVLADSGKDEFNEIFKLIFAKIWDEREAQENRKDKVVEFRKALDPDITYDRINALFQNAADQWPGIFRDGEDIELTKRHLQVCVGPIEGVRLMGSNLRVMDDAFEYLLPTEAKKKKGQFFTPRHVLEMCVRMLNPGRNEYVMDPACGSAGFLLHAMEWCYPARDHDKRELRKFKYASKYLWGIDFETRASKTARALMLITGDGHTNTFKPHTGTKTSVLFFQKYTDEALAKIEAVKQGVAAACPDYEWQIKDLIAGNRYLADVPDENIPEEIADLIVESFAEPEPELPETEPGERDYEPEEPERLMAAEGNPTLEDPDLIGTLKERWIAAKRLDYPIFMAVSERGGKNNSGDYEYRLDEDGSLVEFPDGHPQEGQLVVDQDLVNYDLTAADLADASKIPEKFASIPKFVFQQYRLNKNDVLFNRTNSFEFVGRTAIVKDQTDCTFASYLIRLVPDPNIILPEYLTVYLNTPFGIGQIKRRAMRSINQANVSGAEVKKILMPILDIVDQQKIANDLNAAFGATRIGEQLYRDAQNLLESELGLDKLKFKKPVGYTARCSELEQSRRLDAQHFQPKFDQIINHLSNFDTKRVRDIRLYNRRGVQPAYLDDGPISVVNSQHISPQHIDYDGLQKTSEIAFAASQEGHIQTNDLLIYTTGAYIGRTNVYLSNQPALASNHVNILRLYSGIDTAYMALVLQSVIGEFQTQKHLRGSAQAELYPADIDKFVVPLLDTRKQAAIGDLVRNSLEKQQESKRLLYQAKARVEQLIEEAATR